jgi:hypothetical protein
MLRRPRLRHISAVVVVATTLLLGAGPSRATEQPAGTRTADVAPAVAPLINQAPRQYAVGRRALTFVDSTRPTPADPNRGLPAEPDRTIPVRLLYPANGSPSLPVTDDAPAANGKRPLIVFSHGFTANGPVYEAVVLPWVRSGYNVALPTFPRTSGPGGMLGDYVNQPEDVSFVIDSLLTLNRTPGDRQYRRINAQKLIAAGHSLGAATAYGVTFHSGVGDPRLDAALVFAGIQLPFAGGDYGTRPPTPLLLVHGVLDGTLGVEFSDGMYDVATGPVSYLRLDNAGHINIFAGVEGALTSASVDAFLREHIRGKPRAQEDIAAFVELTGLGEYRRR